MNEYMKMAREQAEKGMKSNEGGPFGAVITDKDGNIIINYPEKISSIEMEISSPEKAGKIHMNTTRTIKNVVNSDIKNADKIYKLENKALVEMNMEEEVYDA